MTVMVLAKVMSLAADSIYSTYQSQSGYLWLL